jgi:two-component system response regulator RegX3
MVSTLLRGAPAATGTGPTILVIEDEATLADIIQYTLQREGFQVLVANDGQRGIEIFRAESPALVVLDLLLPRLSGLDVCRLVRAESNAHVIMISAKDSEADKVTGLELGADDYLTKPFSVNELVSRVRAHLRRATMSAESAPADVISSGPIELNVGRHEVRVRGRIIDLTPKEFDLLQTLMLANGRLRTRNHLIGEVWGPDYYGDTKTLDVHIKRLRQKIEVDPHDPAQIVTVRGLGYRLLDTTAGRASA